MVRIRDVGRVELGAKNQDMSSEVGYREHYWDEKIELYPVANMAIFQLPDANALETADIVKAKMEELKKDFPEGVDYMIRYDTTPFIRESIQEVFKTLLDSVLLVAMVVLLFLQNWRSALIPLIAVPVGIVGTFAVMAAASASRSTTSRSSGWCWRSASWWTTRSWWSSRWNTTSSTAWRRRPPRSRR